MENIILTEEEISMIKCFINDAKNVSSVDGIYIEVYNAKNMNMIPIYVKVLINDSLSYKEELKKNGYIINKEDDEDKINYLVSKYLDYSSRIKFIFSITNDYSPMLMTSAEERAEKSLVSGTILYDRFNNLSDNKNKVSKYISAYENATQIENINELINNEHQKRLGEIYGKYNINRRRNTTD